MKLSIIIPVYNEQETVARIIKKVLQQKNILEILVIDDGSKDASVKEINKVSSSKIKLLKHPDNKGKRAAVITGIKAAKGDFIIIQDADLELEPSDYPALLEPILQKRVDFVNGNRWDKYKKFSLLKMGNLYLRFLIFLLFNINLQDVCSCYKVGPRKIWQKLNLTSQRFEIESEIVAKLALGGYKICEIPIQYHPRKYQEGKKIKFIDAIRGTFKLFRIKLQG